MPACSDLSRAVIGAFRRRARPQRHHGPLLPDPERRHADGCGVRRTLSGPDLRQRPHELMRGAAFLSGVQEAIVVDIGGTTTDVGCAAQGLPARGQRRRRSGRRAHAISACPTCSRSGLGGGSLVVEDGASGRRVGRPAVGRLPAHQDALIFGGKTLTTSDIIVAAGRADFGDRVQGAPSAAGLGRKGAERESRRWSTNAVERMRLTPDPLPVIVVGGGSILVGQKDRGPRGRASPTISVAPTRSARPSPR